MGRLVQVGAMAADSQKYQEKSPLARILANTVWLLGGKGVSAICSLIYLGILTRTLGLKDFGHFSLIYGTSQALVAIAGFQTWRVVVRYGATHVLNKDWEAFGRLGMLAGVVEATGAIAGCLIAYIAFYHFSEALDLNRSLINTAFWFNFAAVWALSSSPTGMVRALDRFDISAYVEAIIPLLRLGTALTIWWTGPSLSAFLTAWVSVDLLVAVIYWITARRLCPQAVKLGHLKGWRRALNENPGLARFFGVTYSSASLDAVVRHGPLLAVGFFASTQAAGLYRLAQQLAQGLGKVSILLTRAVYAEISRARVVTAAAEFRKLAMQTSKIAGLGGLIVVSLSILYGRQLLEMLGGDAFGVAHAILVPLALAASFELASVAFEPVLHSTGKARFALVARLLAATTVVIGVLTLIGPYDTKGAAWAVALGGLVTYLAMGPMALITLRRLDHPVDEPPNTEPSSATP